MTARSLVAALAALLLCAPPAGASLTFSRGNDRDPYKASIYIAKDDGSGARRLGPGEWSAISPDGARVAVVDYPRQRFTLYPAAGGPGLTVNAPDCYGADWSPDSTKLACSNADGLHLIDAASGAVRTVVPDTVGQLSFSPDSTRIAYSTGAYSAGSDVKLVDLATGVTTTLREDATNPVWGPAAIALATIRRQGRYFVLDVARMNPDGSGFQALTHLHPARYRSGIFPVAWSGDGTRLLAGIYGEDAWTTREAYGVDAVRGGFHLVAHTLAPAGFSRDGRFVVGPTGDAECCGYKYSNIARAPWTGGRAKVLVRHSMQSSFNG